MHPLSNYPDPALDPVPQPPEETLDPNDWQAFTDVAHQALDEVLQWQRTVRDRPPWQPLSPGSRAALDEGLPQQPTDLHQVYADFRRHVLPFPTGNQHPRFWGWVMGNGTPVGMLADLLASAMNPHVAGYDQSASAIEKQVLGWFEQIFDYPASSSGLLVSGGTAANLNGLVAARQARAGFDVRDEGLSANRPRLLVYASAQTHSWAERSCELIGLGRRALRKIPVDAEYRIDLDALRQTLARDREAGHRPFCVIGNAGTVNTGAIDDLEALADLCVRQDLWFHVDGALGALAVLAPDLKPLLKGLDRADSIAFDLHKWGYLQYELACILVRDGQMQRNAFETKADYLQPAGRGILPQPLEFANLGIQLSRGFRALKAWMSVKTHGVQAWGRLIRQNVRQIHQFAAKVQAHPRLQLLAPAPLNVACFRYGQPEQSETALNRINHEILLRLQEQGIAIPSSTRLQGRFALRVANTNHRSTTEDFEVLLQSVVELGDRIAQEPGFQEP